MKTLRHNTALSSCARPLMAVAGLGLLVLMTGCSDSPRTPAPGVAAATTSANLPAAGEQIKPQPAKPSPSGAGQETAATLAPPKSPRTHDELRVQAAHRLVAANPQQSYMGAVPEILLAIPVLEVDLNRDGSIKRIVVLRRPRQEPGTVQLAIDAVHRAAPFGDLSRLPAPWKFTETFLFNDERRFKPRTLD
ncbi:hypothetical protein [Roseateles oligotrophus]|uniref:Protein TonB n=1 Tax=Roseateles oligotrophus TaxID=1769250 RepID=A0ABT2YA38_9BURK|nr:hypothetical protein [Roseateles oligotrophus]MCV2367161.1 hypothetical protein [Roseateles oligotrophus]